MLIKQLKNDVESDSVHFDRVLGSNITLDEPGPKNLAELIFSPLEQRSETGEIILGHDHMRFLRISLQQFRFLHLMLYREFVEKGIQPEDRVLLASVPGCNEVFIALLFSALSSYGVRVLMPMFVETEELEAWLSLTGCTAAIVPRSEIARLDHHDREKRIAEEIIKILHSRKIPVYDTLDSFRLKQWLSADVPDIHFLSDPLIKRVIRETGADQEALVITTSGTSGHSKLVVYRQGAFLRNCRSWQRAGLLHSDVLGGRGFTPLFTHTMGIRTFFNALWTGNPVCIINTEWFREHPEIVRYFLIRMRPEHITGGPAAFKLLLEMARTFPELIPVFRSHFKTLVSSGAPFDPGLVEELHSIFGLAVHNALGTTETQQVTNTLLEDRHRDPKPGDLGRPLPGVRLGLKAAGMDRLYHLYIHSPFGCARVLDGKGESSGEEYFYTGDLVELKRGKLFYVGREGKDFFKDGFGVKIPMRSVRDYYRDLSRDVTYIDFYTLQGEPGLAALVFIEDAELVPGKVISKKIISSIKNRFESVNEHLFRELTPFEYRHRTVRRFAVVNSPPPTTVKGNVSDKLIQQEYAGIITALRKYFTSESWVHTVVSRQQSFDAFTEHANSYVGRYLRDLKMDLVYHRAKKDSLFTFKEGREVEVLDLVGGFGANLLGHNAPALQKVMKAYLERGSSAIANQGSIQSEVGQLAEKLNEIFGRETGKNYRVILGSTGSEAVEMALHHACLEWKKQVDKLEQRQLQRFGGEEEAFVREVWAKNRQKIENVRLGVISLGAAFHGHSSGARSLIGNREQREKFSNLLALEAYAIDDTHPDWRNTLHRYMEEAQMELAFVKGRAGRLQSVNRKVSTIIAAIAEPIIGEGGVRPVNRELLQELSNFDFPLILDEIQSGLGRSGDLLVSNGIPGNYYLLGKALGGGLEKISALLIESDRYITEFGKYYATTFGNGELAARVAREVLSLVESQSIPERARQKGEQLKIKLEEVASRYPDVFERITGTGLMLGIRFRDFSKVSHIFLRLMHRQKMLGYVCASYLLNRHRIRILPTLSAPNVLRVEPSAFFADSEIEQLASALEALGRIIRDRSLYELFRHFMEDDPFDDRKGYEPPYGLIYPGVDPPGKEAAQVTFLAHFSYPTDELRILEPSFAQASDTGLRLLFNHLQVLMEMKPVTIFSKNLFEGRVHFQMNVIPLDSAELERLHREKRKREIIEKIQLAVDQAAGEGARVIALGGYTSIFTNNGMALAEPRQTKIISGNTLTAASGILRLQYTMESTFTGGNNPKQVLGIVGAAGNIGLAISRHMIRQGSFDEVKLIVHNAKQKRVVEGEILKTGANSLLPKIRCTTDLGALKNCDVIVVTTNTNKPLIYPHHIKKGPPVLISDNSVPSAVSDEVKELERISVIPFSSYLKLPLDPDFVMSSHTPRGTAFCCAAEAMLCALEEVDTPLRGAVEESSIQLMIELAQKWGLIGEFGSVKTFRSDVYT